MTGNCSSEGSVSFVIGRNSTQSRLSRRTFGGTQALGFLAFLQDLARELGWPISRGTVCDGMAGLSRIDAGVTSR